MKGRKKTINKVITQLRKNIEKRNARKDEFSRKNLMTKETKEGEKEKIIENGIIFMTTE